MNIDLIIIFRAVLTLYVVVALQLNQPHNLYCTAIISQIFAQLSTNLSDLSDCALGSKYYYSEIKIILK